MPNFGEILNQISEEQGRSAFDTVRRRHLAELAAHTGRNVVAYYSGFQQKPGLSGVDIRDEDRDGFMRALHEIDYTKGLDLIIHTPGGSIAATQSIILYLKEKFGRDIRAFVPHTAMSGGTIMACACKVIVMARHSSIGPIDPQLRGVPAKGVIREFEKAYAEIKADPAKAHVWSPILRQYTPTFLGSCQNAITWSEEFAREQLAQNMFYKKSKKPIDKIIRELTEYDNVKLHERQIGYKEARKIGLKIELLEDEPELQDKLLTVHHCFVHTLSNTMCFKIIENQNGAAFMKMMPPPR